MTAAVKGQKLIRSALVRLAVDRRSKRGPVEVSGIQVVWPRHWWESGVLRKADVFATSRVQ
jgi:hypothetical protein